MAKMDRVSKEVGEPVCPIEQKVARVVRVKKYTLDPRDPLIAKVTPELIRFEELFRSEFMAERWPPWRSIKFREGVYGYFGLVRGKYMALIVACSGCHEVFSVSWVKPQMLRHLQGYLSGEKGVRSYSGMIGTLEGVCMRHAHTLVSFQILSRGVIEQEFDIRPEVSRKSL
jgi:hypothetical protein